MARGPTTSILIPVFNRADMLDRCIRSARAQTVADLEIVVIDNASTDGTWEVCQRHAEEDARVRIFRNHTNIGPVRNWARCFEEARGTYGKVLFSDDVMAPRFLEETVPLLADPAVALVFTPVRIGTDPDTDRIEYRWRDRPGRYPAEDFIESCLLDDRVPVSPCAALFRRADLRANLVLEIPSPTISDFPRHGAGPDLLLYLLTARAYPHVGFLTDPLSFFQYHEGAISLREGHRFIGERYFQAKLWFIERQRLEGRREWPMPAQSLCAREWLKHVARTRRLVRPATYLEQYVERPRAIGPWAITRALGYLATRQLERMIHA